MSTQTIAATGEKVGKYRWTIVALLFFATTANYLDRQVLSLLQPTLAEKYNWTNNDYANITSVSMSHLMMLVKGESSEWINNQKFLPQFSGGRKVMVHFRMPGRK
jgi:sugar phosphate permease